MSDIEALAEWLRQRDVETDAAWIERLQAVFTTDLSSHDDPKADMLGERLWKHYRARRERQEKDI